MSISEKEAVLREREAFVNGASWGEFESASPLPRRDGFLWDARGKAHDRYPLPKATRPRIERDPIHGNFDWSVRDGELFFRWVHADRDQWKPAQYDGRDNLLLHPLPPRVALWADLLANPTEEVEE